MNYRDLINAVCPVNCLIYTVQSPARSCPFFFCIHKFGLHFLNSSVCQCASINANYPLHSQGFICSLHREGSTLTADSRVTRCSLPFSFHWLPQSRSQALLVTPSCPGLENMSHKTPQTEATEDTLNYNFSYRGSWLPAGKDHVPGGGRCPSQLKVSLLTSSIQL